MAHLPLPEWVKQQRQLLALERDAALTAALARLAAGRLSELVADGVVIPRLMVLNATTGMWGRTVLTLGYTHPRPLPSHKFTPGDVVGIAAGSTGFPPAGGGVSVREHYDACGVVTEVGECTLTVAVDEEAATGGAGGSEGGGAGGGGGGVGEGDRVRVDQLADDVTFRRLDAVLDDLGAGRVGVAGNVLDLLFGPRDRGAPWPRTERPTADGVDPATQAAAAVAASASHLNDVQRSAIAAALQAVDVAMIHGPPGTGKTTTLVEYIRCEVARGRRVLAVAPSNVAVDNLVERLASPSADGSRAGLEVVRLGHPARVSAATLRHTLEARVAAAEGTALVADVRRDLDKALSGKTRGLSREQRAEQRFEVRRLRQELRSRQDGVVRGVVRGAHVVAATITGAASTTLRRAMAETSESGAGGGEGGSGRDPRWFDVVVIDEVAQALEVACMIPLLLGKKLVIAGGESWRPEWMTSH